MTLFNRDADNFKSKARERNFQVSSGNPHSFSFSSSICGFIKYLATSAWVLLKFVLLWGSIFNKTINMFFCSSPIFWYRFVILNIILRHKTVGSRSLKNWCKTRTQWEALFCNGAIPVMERSLFRFYNLLKLVFSDVYVWRYVNIMFSGSQWLRWRQ